MNVYIVLNHGADVSDFSLLPTEVLVVCHILPCGLRCDMFVLVHMMLCDIEKLGTWKNSTCGCMGSFPLPTFDRVQHYFRAVNLVSGCSDICSGNLNLCFSYVFIFNLVSM